jgi:hypothetical protein
VGLSVKPQHPMKIRVMADYGSSGIWAFFDPPAKGESPRLF